ERESRESEWGRQEGSRSSFYPGGYGFEEQSSPYGQREAYENRSYSPQDYSEGRSEGRGGSYRGSRYSESQYGQGQYGQGEYDPRRNWGGRSTASRSSQGSDDWDRGSPPGGRQRRSAPADGRPRS